MSLKEKNILVCGAGGFIGGHLVAHLRQQGFENIRAVDCKPLSDWYQMSDGVHNLQLDLSLKEQCEQAVQNMQHVYNLAANMGGMGFIETNKTLCMLNVLINTHLLMASKHAGIQKYFFASSACVYAHNKQTDNYNPGLKELDAYPAMPEDGYGWEKLFSERMCRHFREDYGLETYCGRYHNVYGPLGCYDGGKEKAPAALIRKVATAKINNLKEIEIWGDGEQMRSFMYVEDCVEGTLRLSASNFYEPINIGTTEIVTINELLDIIESIAQIKLKRIYNKSAPKGVNGRNSDNTLIQSKLNWQPSINLVTGLRQTYDWIYNQLTVKTS